MKFQIQRFSYRYSATVLRIVLKRLMTIRPKFPDHLRPPFYPSEIFTVAASLMTQWFSSLHSLAEEWGYVLVTFNLEHQHYSSPGAQREGYCVYCSSPLSFYGREDVPCLTGGVT